MTQFINKGKKHKDAANKLVSLANVSDLNVVAEIMYHKVLAHLLLRGEEFYILSGGVNGWTGEFMTHEELLNKLTYFMDFPITHTKEDISRLVNDEMLGKYWFDSSPYVYDNGHYHWSVKDVIGSIGSLLTKECGVDKEDVEWLEIGKFPLIVE